MNKKGFTLVEVLVSIVLVTIVMISMLATLVKIRNTYSNLNNNADAVLFSSTISRVLNNDAFQNSGIRRYLCSADNMRCELILGNDEYRILEIIDSTNTAPARVIKDGKVYKLAREGDNKRIRVLNTIIKDESTFNPAYCSNIKSNCLSITADTSGCRCSKEIETTTLRYTDPLNEKTLLVRSIDLIKNINANGIVTSTEGHQFKYIDSFSRAYDNKASTGSIADVISVFTIYVYDGLDSNDQTYNIHLASSSISNNSAAYVGNRYELALGLGKYESSLRAKDETNLISDKSGNFIGSIYENFGVGFSSPYGPAVSQIGVPYVSDALDPAKTKFAAFLGFYDCLGLPAGDIAHPELNTGELCNVDSVVNGQKVKRVIDEFGNILINSNYYHTDVQLTALWGSASNVNITLDHAGGKVNGATSTVIHERYATGWFSSSNSEVKIASVPVPIKEGSTFGGYFSSRDGTGTRYINPDGTIVGIPNFKTATTLYAYWVETTKVINFNSSKHIQNYVAPYSGYYQLEVWGASGGYSGAGGLGGYATGVVYLDKGQILYVVPGGEGSSNRDNQGGFNGGGGLSNLVNSGAGTGGGATHIATTLIGTGVLSNYSASRDKILIVAGGGGGRSSTGTAGTSAGGYRSKLGGGNATQNENAMIYSGFRYSNIKIGSTTYKVTDWSNDVRSAGFGSGETRATKGGPGAGGGGYYGGVGGYVATNSNFGSGSGGTGSIENDNLITYLNNEKGISIIKHMYCYDCDSTTRELSNMNVPGLKEYFPEDLDLSKYATYNNGNILEVVNGSQRLKSLNSTKQPERVANCKISSSVGMSTSNVADCAKRGNGAARITLIEMNTEEEEGKLSSKTTFAVELDYDGGVVTLPYIYEKYGAGWAQNADDTVQLFRITPPVKDNYLFGGFYTSKNGQGTQCIDENGAILMDANYVSEHGFKLYAYWINATQNFAATGGVQTFTANRPGYYKIELWGAGGGNISSSVTGGHGGYATGVVELNAGDMLYIYVGKTTTGLAGGYNGGGNGKSNTKGGGGATHVSLVAAPNTYSDNPLRSTITNSALENQVILVAGGGGGQTNTVSTSNQFLGNAGGYVGRGNFGGKAEEGFKGYGQSSGNANSGGGGGGYYGGRTLATTSGGNQNCGGGGTGYINNDFVKQNMLNVIKHMTCSDCPVSLEVSTMTYQAIDKCTSTSSNVKSDCPMAGGNNGYARVTLLQIKTNQ